MTYIIVLMYIYSVIKKKKNYDIPPIAAAI